MAHELRSIKRKLESGLKTSSHYSKINTRKNSGLLGIKAHKLSLYYVEGEEAYERAASC